MSENKMRPTWDQYFLDIALAVSKRATCSRLQCACVIVNEDHQIVATGYNGAPAGLRHCDHRVREQVVIGLNCTTMFEGPGDMENGHCSRAQHAERNAIAQAAKHGVSVKGATCYTSGTPCLDCARLLVSAGIKRHVFGLTYRSDAALALYDEAGIEYSGPRVGVG